MKQKIMINKKDSKKSPKKRFQWKLLLFCLVIVYFIALIGSQFTEIGTWYNSVKPSITPPSYVFPIVWNILFFLIALSLYFVLASSKGKHKEKISVLFGLNLFLNILWSFLFFKLKNPKASFIELIVLWLSILTMIIACWKIDRKSSWLLVPYLLWVGFAGILNYLIAF